MHAENIGFKTVEMNNIFKELVSGPGYLVCDDIASNDCGDISILVAEAYAKLFSIPVPTLDDFPLLYNSNSYQNLNVFQRTLDINQTTKILSQQWITNLCASMNLEPVDTYNFGWPALTWRYVPPFNESVIRGAHRDVWFRLVNGESKVINETLPLPCQTIKIWVALNITKGKSGLLVCPNSQKSAYEDEYIVSQADNILKPIVSNPVINDDLRLLDMSSGQYVIFGENLIHAGAPNKSQSARISLEFTLAAKGYCPKPYKL